MNNTSAPKTRGWESFNRNGPGARDAHFPQSAEVTNQLEENYQYDQSAYNSETVQQHDTVSDSRRPQTGTREDRQLVPGRPELDVRHDRRSDEFSQGPPLRHQGAFQSESGRSKTMPSAISNPVMERPQQGYTEAFTGQSSDRNVNGFTFDTRGHQPVRPSTASGVRPAGPGGTRSGEIARIRAEQTRSPMGNVKPHAQQKTVRPPAVHQDSIADLYDSYYEPSAPSQPYDGSQNWDHNHQPLAEEDLPDFDALNLASPGRQRGMNIEHHINPPVQPPKMPPMPAQYRHQSPSDSSAGNRSRQFMQSKSQPDLKHRSPPKTQQDNGFDFGIPQHEPAVLDTEYRTNVGLPKSHPKDMNMIVGKIRTASLRKAHRVHTVRIAVIKRPTHISHPTVGQTSTTFRAVHIRARSLPSHIVQTQGQNLVNYMEVECKSKQHIMNDIVPPLAKKKLQSIGSVQLLQDQSHLLKPPLQDQMRYRRTLLLYGLALCRAPLRINHQSQHQFETTITTLLHCRRQTWFNRLVQYRSLPTKRTI